MAGIFVMIYPWSVKDKAMIFNELDKLGRRIKTKIIQKASLEIIKEQFSKWKEKSFYKNIVNDFKNKEIVIALYDGDREKFAEIKEKMRNENVPFQNLTIEDKHKNGVIHTSRDDFEFNREIELWKRFL